MAHGRGLTMRIAVDALPINNFSGRHVLLGHLRNVAAATVGKHSFHVFHHAGNRDLCRDLGPNVEWIECPVGASWPRRIAWQALAMKRRLRDLRTDLLISTSGAVVPRAGVPQIVLAQNPWCFFPQFHRTLAQKTKALLQRAGYRRAQRTAAAVFYLSDYVGAAYRANAGVAAKYGATLYVGVSDAMFAQAEQRTGFSERALEIVAVSVMTPHKAVEDIVATLGVLHRRGVAARLALVGPWSDAGYRATIEGMIAERGLTDAVTITGGVDDAALVAHYRRARVFCLLSRCESFGIPSVEAQVFGTPTVVADACAPPEVAGPGGVVTPIGDVERAADALVPLLTDESAWTRASEAAFRNAERFRWSRVSGPLIDYLRQRDS